MGLENITLSEVNQAEKDKYDTTYMWNLKNNTNTLTYKTETDSQTSKTNLPEGKRGGINKEFGIADIYIYRKYANNKHLQI